MGRHRRRRGRRPTIVIPGSSQLPRRPVATAVIVAGTLAVTPGMLQMGDGDMSPLEGSARITPPTNALGVPSLSDYDEEGRLILEAAPGAIRSVTAVQLTSEPISVSPVVADAVAATLAQMQPRPLEAAMSFGPADVETVRIDELGIPVATEPVGGSNSVDGADVLGLAPLGIEAVVEAEAGGGSEVGRTLGEDRIGSPAGGAEALGVGAAAAPAGPGGSGADRGDSEAPRIVAAPYPGDAPQGPAAGGSATDADPCPISSTFPTPSQPVPEYTDGGGTSGSGTTDREGLEGQEEFATQGAPSDRDVRPVPVVEVVDNQPGPVRDDGDLPEYVGPVLDTPNNDVDVHDPVRPVDDRNPEPVLADRGSDSDSPEPDRVQPTVPSVPDEVDEVVWEDGPDPDAGKGNDKPWDDKPDVIEVPDVDTDDGDAGSDPVTDPVDVPDLPTDVDLDVDPVGDDGGSDPVGDADEQEPVVEVPDVVEDETPEPVEVDVPDEVDEPVEDVSEPVEEIVDVGPVDSVDDEGDEPADELEPVVDEPDAEVVDEGSGAADDADDSGDSDVEVDVEPVVVVDYEEEADEPTEETETDADASDNAGEDGSSEPSEGSDEESEGASDSGSSGSESEDAPESSSDDSGDDSGSADESERDDSGAESSESDSGSDDSGSAGDDSSGDSGSVESDSGEDS